MRESILNIKCSPEAREKCPFDHPCGSEEEAYFEDGSACDAFNKKLMPPPPMTNAQYIRSMTDEEMETELLPLFEELCEDGIPSPEYMRFWLKQLYKEN